MIGDLGHLIVVDPHQHQIQHARNYVEYHTTSFCQTQTNLQFIQSSFNDLHLVADGSIDVLLFHNVLSQSQEMQPILTECFRVLKEGGELLFADRFLRIRIPRQGQWEDCVPGIYFEDLRRAMNRAGFIDPRVVTSFKVSSADPIVDAEMIQLGLTSKTIRSFKISSLEDSWENFGQLAMYNGTINNCTSHFLLDKDNLFMASQAVPVSSNTADMLAISRYKDHFTITQQGDHLGPFQDWV